MSEWTKVRQAFYKEVVSHGIGDPKEFNQAFPLGHSVPEGKLETWLKRFLNVEHEFHEPKRYINRFKIGADPEFIFTHKPPGEYENRVDALHLGLKQGLAFGADNNGRLAEIRPFPSRSALEVCGSTLSTLRWLYLTSPDSRLYNWCSGAYLHKDGLGGHVHFGRKRPGRADEVRALDALNELLMLLNVYPVKEIVMRQRGDARGQIYGRPGDFRLQTHGYEYRTFPSWLDSPGLAFLTLTLSKLAVSDPELVLHFQQKLSTLNQYRKLLNFLAYYKGLDDDARLAYIMCQRGLPVHLGGDFRSRWGISGNPAPLSPALIPLSFPSDPDTNKEMFDHLMSGFGLKMRIPKWFGPDKLPKGYHMCIARAETVQHKGLGEMIWDICASDEIPLQLRGGRSGFPILTISEGLIRHLGRGWRKGLPEEFASITDGGKQDVYISASHREGQWFSLTKRLLLNGTLPIWKIGEVKPESYKKWKESRGEEAPERKLVSRLIEGVGPDPLLRGEE